MDICILMGSPRQKSNTAALLEPFTDELRKSGISFDILQLKSMELKPCTACRACQKSWESFGCVQKDGLYEIFEKIMECRMIVLASPIYSWYCTPQMKIVLDRLVYGMNKIYGEKAGPRLWQGRQLSLITTCGYPPEKGADLWEEGMKRFCRHSGLIYTKMLVERHSDYSKAFMDSQKEENARAFAREMAERLK